MKTFLEIATSAISRHFPFAPVHPDTKRGVLYNQFKNPPTTTSEANQLARDFPNHSVGVIGKCIVGWPVILDADAPGVVEKFESDTKTTLPETYQVQSQPQNKPWKRHIYFRHTEYSVARLKAAGRGGKAIEIRVKDLSKDANVYGNYPALFDLIGSGQGAFVVAEGSRHPRGETYTGNGVFFEAPIPDALVDWVIQESVTARRELARRREVEKKAKKIVIEDVETMIAAGQKVKSDRISKFYRSRVCSFASLACTKTEVVRLVISQIKRHFIDGDRLAQEYAARVKRYVSNPGIKWGKAHDPRRTPDRPINTDDSVTNYISPLEERRDTVEYAISSFTPTILSSLARERVDKALARVKLAPLSGESGKKVFILAMKRSGYKMAGYEGNDRVWKRYVRSIRSVSASAEESRLS
jgi:hypothetical protein